MATVRYRVPYQIVVNAHDIGSLKKVTNILYVKTGFTLGAAVPYGDPIAGPSSNGAFLIAFANSWLANVCPFLNHNYEVEEFVCHAILGKRYKTVRRNVIAVTPLQIGAQIYVDITFGSAHGWATGATVLIESMTTGGNPPDGIATIAVMSPTVIRVPIPLAYSGWTGGGTVQLAFGEWTPILEDRVSVAANPGVYVGGIAGDALPLFSTASVRKRNAGTGRNFRGRLSFSPMSESDSVDGGYVAGRITAINAALATFVAATLGNNGTDAGDSLMSYQMLSTKLMFAQPSPFQQSVLFTANITSMTMQRNCGSLTRRKPKLTQIIT